MCLLHREGFCYCWRRYDFKSLHHVKGYHRKKTTGLKRKPSHNSHIGCFIPIQFSSVQFSRSVMSNSLWPHGLQHARLPYPSPTLKACSNSCPWSRWCHPTTSFFLNSFSSCLQSFSASGSFLRSQFFASGDQTIAVSASASVLPMNIQDWSPFSPRDSQESSPTPQFKSISSSALSFLYSPTHIHTWLLEKP